MILRPHHWHCHWSDCRRCEALLVLN